MFRAPSAEDFYTECGARECVSRISALVADRHRNRGLVVVASDHLAQRTGAVRAASCRNDARLKNGGFACAVLAPEDVGAWCQRDRALSPTAHLVKPHALNH